MSKAVNNLIVVPMDSSRSRRIANPDLIKEDPIKPLSKKEKEEIVNRYLPQLQKIYVSFFKDFKDKGEFDEDLKQETFIQLQAPLQKFCKSLITVKRPSIDVTAYFFCSFFKKYCYEYRRKITDDYNNSHNCRYMKGYFGDVALDEDRFESFNSISSEQDHQTVANTKAMELLEKQPNEVKLALNYFLKGGIRTVYSHFRAEKYNSKQQEQILISVSNYIDELFETVSPFMDIEYENWADEMLRAFDSRTVVDLLKEEGRIAKAEKEALRAKTMKHLKEVA